jgi:hypothetical protein
VEIMSKSQRNALWRALAENGLHLGEFSYDPKFREDGISVYHIPSQSIFKIYSKGYQFTFTSQVGDDPAAVTITTRHFENIVEEVGRWGREAAEWMETPDLWKSVPDSASIPGELTPDSGNTNFAPAEQAAISAQLKEIAESIKKTYELTAEQSDAIDKKFEEAEKASQRMGRKDWGVFFGGIALSLVLADIITPEIMGHIFLMIQHGIGHLFSGPAAGGVLSAGQD